MSDKVSLIEVDNIYSPTAATNIMANFRAIQTRLNETVSRDGLAPNFMKSVLDMNGYDIINIGELTEGTGGGTGSGGQSGSTYNLVHDGATDQTEEFVAAIETAVASGESYMKFLRPADATGALYLGERATLEAATVHDILIDLTDIDILYSNKAEIFLQGEFDELPATGIPTLVGDVSAGDTTITIDAVDAPTLALFTTYNTGVIRGQNDVFGVALPDQREVIRWTNVDDSGGVDSVVLTLASPLEFSYDEENVGSDWAPGESGIDRTLITVRVGTVLSANADEGDGSITATLTSFDEGDYVIVDALTTTGDTDLELPTGEDIRRITDITGTTGRLNRPLSRAMTTAGGASLYRLTTIDNVHIVGPKSITVSGTPEGGRKHLIHGQYASNCSVTDFHYDANDSASDVTGQVVRWARSIDCKTLRCSGKNRGNIGAGNGNMFSAFYSNGIVISECGASRGRHHYIVQGGSDIAVINNTSQDAGTNDLDTHGVGENRVYFHGNRLLPGPTQSPDTTLQTAITIGNTRWRSASKNIVVTDNTAYNYTDAAVLIRAPSEKITIKNNDFSYCGYGVRAAIDNRAGQISIDDVILHSNVYRDSVTDDVDITQNEAPAWDIAETYFGTTARPVYASNDSKLYSTSTTTLGGSAPTHSSGTTGSWTYVAATANRITNFTNRDDALDSGAVIGPASSTDNRIALFDGVTGKLIKQASVGIDGLATAAQGALADTSLQPGSVCSLYESTGELVDDVLYSPSTSGAVEEQLLMITRSGTDGAFVFEVDDVSDAPIRVEDGQTLICRFNGTSWVAYILGATSLVTSGGSSFSFDQSEVVVTSSRALTDADYAVRMDSDEQNRQLIRVRRVSGADLTLTFPDAPVITNHDWPDFLIEIDDTYTNPVILSVSSGSINGRSSIQMLPGRGNSVWVRLQYTETGPDAAYYKAVGNLRQSYTEHYETLNASGASVEIDYALANDWIITLTGDVTAAPTIVGAPATGRCVLTIELVQDGTGGRAWIDPDGTDAEAGAVALPTGAGDSVFLVYTSINGFTTSKRSQGAQHTS